MLAVASRATMDKLKAMRAVMSVTKGASLLFLTTASAFDFLEAIFSEVILKAETGKPRLRSQGPHVVGQG